MRFEMISHHATFTRGTDESLERVSNVATHPSALILLRQLTTHELADREGSTRVSDCRCRVNSDPRVPPGSSGTPEGPFSVGVDTDVLPICRSSIRARRACQQFSS